MHAREVYNSNVFFEIVYTSPAFLITYMRACRDINTSAIANIGGPERLKSYPTEPFTMSNKKRFCSGCREELPLKKTTIELHMKSVKHASGKE